MVAGYSFDTLPSPASSHKQQQQQPGGAQQQQHSDSNPPPSLNWLLVPGGIGTRQEVHNTVLLDYIRSWCADPAAAGLDLVMSVCTGSALLAAAGVLDGR